MKSLIHTIAVMVKSGLSSLRGKYWLDALYDYSGSDLIYIGLNESHNEPQTKETWYIWKLTYDVNGEITRKEGPIVAAWDERTSQRWAE